MKNNGHGLDTKLVHAGEPRPGVAGAVALPVFQSATYEYSGDGGEYHDLKYIRLNNTPNHLALHRKLAALENTEDALVFGSGMAAITTSLLTVLSHGDHIILQDCLYGGTRDFVTKDLPAYGISYDFISADKPGDWKRGLKTLGVRVRRQNESALALARFLSRHRALATVNYPGLPSSGGHGRAKALFDGFGGMLSFELKGGLASARRFMKRVTLPVVAPSLGGVESLVTRPSTTSHARMSPQEREALGIKEGLVRVSVGLEDAADLIADFSQALR